MSASRLGPLLSVLGSLLGAAACAQATDCNSNGVDDADDIETGYSLDADSNGVPDECEWCDPVVFTTEEDFLAGFRVNLNVNTNGGDQLRVNMLPEPLPWTWVAASAEAPRIGSRLTESAWDRVDSPYPALRSTWIMD